MKLPIKTRVLEYAIEMDGCFRKEEIAKAMEAEYQGERTTTVKNIEKIIRTYCGVGIMRASDIALTEDGKLDITYEVTEFGKRSL
ncbi:MAG: hypothetical protein ACOYBL_00480 [Lachnospiraceae bacterium]|jgi:hypothetical protein